jgi:hypothetical protein
MSELKVGDLVYYPTNDACELAVVVSGEDAIDIVTCSGSHARIIDRHRISHSSLQSYEEAAAALRLFERRALNLARAIQILKSKQQANDE